MKTNDRGERPMISRLVLLGMVAALGVTLPSEQECARWFDAMRVWASAELADWDTWKPKDRDLGHGLVRPPRGRFACSESATRRGAVPDQRSPSNHSLARPQDRARLASGSAAAANPLPAKDLPSQPKRVSFEPIALDHTLESGVAYELNHMSEGTEMGVAAAKTGEIESSFAPGIATDWLELRLAVSLAERIDASRRSHAPDTSGLHASKQSEITRPLSERITANPTPPIPPTAVVATVDPRPRVEPNRPTPEPRQETYPEIPYELNRLFAGLEAQTEERRPAPTVARTVIEPIEVTSDLESGIAYELNRMSEGVGIAVPPVRGPAEDRVDRPTTLTHASPSANERSSAPTQVPATTHLAGGGDAVTPPTFGRAEPRDANLGQAIRLTRDAACAWMNVLLGPAMVRMTSR
jgi:hypothetical protein